MCVYDINCMYTDYIDIESGEKIPFPIPPQAIDAHVQVNYLFPQYPFVDHFAWYTTQANTYHYVPLSPGASDDEESCPSPMPIPDSEFEATDPDSEDEIISIGVPLPTYAKCDFLAYEVCLEDICIMKDWIDKICKQNETRNANKLHQIKTKKKKKTKR